MDKVHETFIRQSLIQVAFDGELAYPREGKIVMTVKVIRKTEVDVT